MEEGQVYDIFKFYTKPDPSKFKVVDHATRLHFNESTKFIKVEQLSTPIPRHSFHLIDFSQLAQEEQKQNDPKGKSTVLTDIYGCIKSVTPEHQVFAKKKNRMESKCEIVVENVRREDLKITLWGDLAKSFELQAIQKLPPPVLAVFTSLRLSIYQGVAASSSNHTCIILNPSLPQTEEYRTEFNKPGDRPKILATPFRRQTVEELKQKDKKTVSELNTLDPQEYTNKTVFCTATILRFPEHNGWWFRACPESGCYKQLIDNDNSGNYACTQHGLPESPHCCSYRVSMTVHDSDGQATLTLMGKEAERFFNITCAELLDKRSYPTEQTIPEEIKEKVGQTFLFEIRVDFNGALVVRAIYPDPDFPEPTMMAPITVPTPDRPHSERKRSCEDSGKALFLSESEKKSKRETKQAIPASSSKKQEDKLKAN